jgi:soluble lytic murein transglycosylase
MVAAAALGGLWLARQVRARHIEARLDGYQTLIARHATDNGLSEALVRSVIRAESGGDPRAVSPAGARGLMQLMPAAEQDVRRWRRLAEPGDLFDPDYNIRVGSAYLGRMLDQFGDERLAVAAYNMGPSALKRLQQDHPDLAPKALIERYAPAETRAYCRAVLGD